MHIKERLLLATRKPAASSMLFGVSVLESVVFPIPPDVMLVPMVLGNRSRWLFLGLLTTFGSVVGAFIGYFIGLYALETIGMPIIQYFDAVATFEALGEYYQRYGAPLLLIAGVTPIPFKIFTITSGALHMALLPFIFCAIIGRAFRFVLVAGLTMRYGERVLGLLSNKKYTSLFSILCIIIIMIGYWLLTCYA